MTLPRLAAVSKRWEEVPPLAVSVVRIAYSLGYTPPKKKTEEPAHSASEMIGTFAGLGFASGKPAWLKAAEERDGR